MADGALRAGLGALALAIAAATPAAAQGPDMAGFSGPYWQIGGAVFVAPKFEGSKSYSAFGLPFIAPAGVGGEDGFVQIKGPDNVRFRLLQRHAFEAGPLLGYRFGRDSSDSVRLTGLEDIDGGLVAGAYAGYRAGSLFLSVSYHHQVTGDDTGGLVRLAVEHTGNLGPRVKLTTSVGTAYASSDYMSAFFGITPAQSIASGLPVYDASAGFKDVSAGITAQVALDERWTLLLTGRYTHLIGDAADSPIVESESQWFGGVGLTYKFAWTR